MKPNLRTLHKTIPACNHIGGDRGPGEPDPAPPAQLPSGQHPAELRRRPQPREGERGGRNRTPDLRRGSEDDRGQPEPGQPGLPRRPPESSGLRSFGQRRVAERAAVEPTDDDDIDRNFRTSDQPSSKFPRKPSMKTPVYRISTSLKWLDKV